MMVFRSIHPSGLATSPLRWTTLLCTDTLLRDTAPSDAPRYYTLEVSPPRLDTTFAQVVLDESGFSKGYGFVRFGNEQEQQHALGCMTGEMGLGSKPIKVTIALCDIRITNTVSSGLHGKSEEQS